MIDLYHNYKNNIMRTLIDALKWRSAIKNFDSTKEVSQENIEQLIIAANLAATSGGLQPFKLIVIKNKELREKLTPASYGQSQIAQASHLLVFAVLEEFDKSIVDEYVTRMAEVRNLELSSLNPLKEALSGSIHGKDASNKTEWAARQVYISLGTVLSAAATMEIDMCPMEGFNPMQYQEILDLKSKNLLPVVIAAVGYRSDDDVFSKMAKVRKARKDFVLEID